MVLYELRGVRAPFRLADKYCICKYQVPPSRDAESEKKASQTAFSLVPRRMEDMIDEV